MATLLEADPRAFPSSPPADLDDHELIVKNDWYAFAALERMTDHWARPGWSDGRRAYYWMLTFSDCPRLLSHAQRCQNELADLGMDPVPDDGLHVTMVRIGDTSQVTNDQLHRLTDLAARLPLAAFRFRATPLAGSRGAIRYSLSPWGPLIRLHAVLSAIGRQTGVPGGKPTAAFRPHLGIQYNNRDRPAAPVIASVAHLRTLPPVHLDITSVDLVELRRARGEQRAYRWDVQRRIPLGHHHSPAGEGGVVPFLSAGEQ
ncbi:2'-5' RNA ligase family protein [Streptomyces sp. PU-14G]|uniref:2'-5' RNA ligase family protein n=1 Tax=Streptomyces sp. PU-14G TaxID=2800808 RepID=UPI0034DF4641